MFEEIDYNSRYPVLIHFANNVCLQRSRVPDEDTESPVREKRRRRDHVHKLKLSEDGGVSEMSMAGPSVEVDAPPESMDLDVSLIHQ